jgi:GNAT superfamily N-acetyltransferase
MLFPPIRLTAADAERFAQFRLRMLTESPWAFAASPDDDHAVDITELTALLSDPESAILAVESLDARVADSGGNAPALVAAAGITRMKRRKFAHRARIWGVFVDPEERGKGLASALVAAAVDLSRRWPGLAYIDLGVTDIAADAVHLYERRGFRAWGREPGAIQHDGRRYDAIHMTLTL